MPLRDRPKYLPGYSYDQSGGPKSITRQNYEMSRPFTGYYVYDNRNGNTQGPYDRTDASKLCADLNDYVERNMTEEEKKTKTHQRERRPFTFGTKDDFAQSGKFIAVS